MTDADEPVLSPETTEPPEPADSVEGVEPFYSKPPPPPRPPRPRQARTWPIFLAVLLIFLVAGVFVYWFGPGSELRPFKPHLMEYAATKGLVAVSGPPPAVVGKVIIIDGDNGIIDPATFQLPPDLKPTRHADIGSVVIFKRQPVREAGEYTIGQYGFRQVWRVVLVDRASKIMYRWADIEGPDPRSKVQEKEGNQTGPPPTSELLAAIAKLDRAKK